MTVCICRKFNDHFVFDNLSFYHASACYHHRLSSSITPKAAHNTKNTQNTVIIHVEPKNLKKRNNKWQGTDRQTDDLMQSTIYRHSVTLFYTLTEMCPAVTDLITKLFQIHDFISCCDDERDNKLYFASKDNTRHCLVVQSKACRIVLELFIIRLYNTMACWSMIKFIGRELQ